MPSTTGGAAPFVVALVAVAVVLVVVFFGPVDDALTMRWTAEAAMGLLFVRVGDKMAALAEPSS